METVSFSGKAGVKAKTTPEQKPEQKQKQKQNQKSKIDYDKLVGDQSWYQSYCNECPYLINADVLNMLVCGCPADEECLAKGMLVAASIVEERYVDYQKQMQNSNAKNKVSPPIKRKKIKTRRSGAL